MKITVTQLRKIINDTVNSMISEGKHIRRAGARGLDGLIFEDAGDDVAGAFKGGPGAARTLANTSDDKQELKKALQGGYDGKPDDDKVNVKKGGQMSVGDLLPTQSEIDLVKSIGWPLGDFKTLEKMITSGTSTAPGTITVSGNLVIDGHHRWSGVWSISGPEGTVLVDDLELPGDSQAEKLAAAQLAIAAYKEPDATQPAAAEPIDLNILGKDPAAIEKDIMAAEGQKDPKAPGALLNPKYLEDCSKSEVVAAWAGFKVGDSSDKVKKAIVKKTASNLAGLPKNSEAPARADMPQFDHDDIGGKKAKAAIIKGLEQGEFNVAPPFKPGAAQESVKSRDNLVLERWQKLAGLIK
jgi:hypothetical protein